MRVSVLTFQIGEKGEQLVAETTAESRRYQLVWRYVRILADRRKI